MLMKILINLCNDSNQTWLCNTFIFARSLWRGYIHWAWHSVFLKSLSGPEESYCKKYHVLIPIFTRAQNLIEADDICVPW